MVLREKRFLNCQLHLYNLHDQQIGIKDETGRTNKFELKISRCLQKLMDADIDCERHVRRRRSLIQILTRQSLLTFFGQLITTY